jgi:ferritin-like metal-binding protein YciE
MPKLTTLDELLLHDLGDIYDAEYRFLDGQKEMLAAATDRELKRDIKAHIAQTEGQIERLDRAYELIGQKAKRVKCPVAVGLVKEAQDGIADAEENPKVRDIVIACAAAKVEHYEISSYRSLIAAVASSGQAELLEIFRANLAEEEATAAKIEESTPALLSKAAGKRRAAARAGA